MSEITISPNSADGGAASAAPVIIPGPRGTGASSRILGGTAIPSQVREFVSQPAVAKAMPLIGFIGVVMLAILAWAAMREPPQRDLFRGLPDSDKGAVIAALQTALSSPSPCSALNALKSHLDVYDKSGELWCFNGVTTGEKDWTQKY